MTLFRRYAAYSFFKLTHGSRRGLYSSAASRLKNPSFHSIAYQEIQLPNTSQTDFDAGARVEVVAQGVADEVE